MAWWTDTDRPPPPWGATERRASGSGKKPKRGSCRAAPSHLGTLSAALTGAVEPGWLVEGSEELRKAHPQRGTQGPKRVQRCRGPAALDATHEGGVVASRKRESLLGKASSRAQLAQALAHGAVEARRLPVH